MPINEEYERKLFKAYFGHSPDADELLEFHETLSANVADIKKIREMKATPCHDLFEIVAKLFTESHDLMKSWDKLRGRPDLRQKKIDLLREQLGKLREKDAARPDDTNVMLQEFDALENANKSGKHLHLGEEKVDYLTIGFGIHILEDCVCNRQEEDKD